MKRFIVAAIAATALAAPLAIATDADAQHRRGGHDRDYRDGRDRDRDYRRDNRRDRDWRDDRRDNRRAYRQGRRDQRAWDRRAHNGYYHNNRWYYGPPRAEHRRYARHAYRAWRRGDRLPSYYRHHYRPVDYRHYRNLRRPPRGYHYVRDDRGDLILVGIATGVILSVILAGN